MFAIEPSVSHIHVLEFQKIVPSISMTTRYNVIKKIVPSMTTRHNVTQKIVPSMTTSYNVIQKIVPSMTTRHKVTYNIARLKCHEAQDDTYDWAKNARPNQKLPDGDWKTWLIIAGRGFGKTRTGAESVRQLVTQQTSMHVALIGQTIDETRSVMVEGVSGIMAVSPPRDEARLEYPKRRLTWSNGATAQLFSADRYD
ncbi:MAG: hypothetical protein LBR89_00170, partial [Holosporales bacterium]|nr:hypothetical protein [Holosporales bacterium]